MKNSYQMKLKKRRVLRKRDAATVYIFGLGLLLLFVLGMALPLRPTVSDVEKRELEKFPKFQLETFLNGEYFGQISTWYADTFPFREKLLSANSAVKELYGIKTQQLYGNTAVGDEIPDVIPEPNASGEQPSPDEDPAALASAGAQEESAADSSPEAQVSEESSDGAGQAEEAAAAASEPEETEEQLPDATIHVEPEVAGTVYIAEGRGFELYYFSREGADLYASVINEAAQKLAGTATVYDMLVPTAVSVCLDEQIQESLKSSPQDKAFDYVYSMIQDPVKKVSVFDTLKKHNAEYIYFNTDHHWTALGAYYAYREFAQAKGIEPKSLDSYQKVTFDHFIGSFYSFSNQAEALKNNPDTIEAYVPSSTNNMMFVEKSGEQRQWKIINDVSQYAAGVKYSCFIGGDNPYSRIDNPVLTDGSSCVVIKESYGNAFVPFLVDHYQTVHVIDYRYYKGNLVDFVKENGVQDVIFVNNADVLNTSKPKQIQALLGA
ncbi:MAG TPA: hypothetical protein IAA07_08810 [Candidatus Lachnoclostridium stercoravium]|uniref:DHHW protein n=1 Tax=Candidatus Lachnoclostridium stercoravium TaxID=2838633 RepID=A0A9D2HJW6_9FIRM|nr:hypothetical protein [Candidatus Lachnoclostridium stercoravium]